MSPPHQSPLQRLAHILTHQEASWGPFTDSGTVHAFHWPVITSMSEFPNKLLDSTWPNSEVFIYSKRAHAYQGGSLRATMHIPSFLSIPPFPLGPTESVSSQLLVVSTSVLCTIQIWVWKWLPIFTTDAYSGSGVQSIAPYEPFPTP